MAKAISNEKRADIIKHMEAGEAKGTIAKWLFVCVKTIARVWQRYQETGSYEARPQNSGRKPKVSEETMNKVMAKIKETPDSTLRELIDEFDLGISQAALCKRLKKAGLTYKKKRSMQMSKNEKT